MKRNFTSSKKAPNYGRILAWVLALGMVLMYLNSQAQFTIKQDFKGSNVDNAIILGGSPAAYLTSGKEDPIGEGWLRVTKAAYQQKGYAYINKSFPSSLGVFIDFEYTAWADAVATYGGADGFSIYLFDATYGPGSFQLGGYGGSLGYANYIKSGETTQPGLKGGYLGIGIDEYGNFSNPTEGRNGGPGFTPNAIVLRGPTTSNNSTTNKYLAGTTLGKNNAVDYVPIVKNRPSASKFYRRIQIQIDPVAGNKYHIQVRWATSVGGSFAKLLDYTTTDKPPALMKVGFAASTGQGFNYHEIRNLFVTTPGGVRIDKRVNKTSAAVGEQLKYSVNVTNATTADLKDLILTDTLRDAKGNLLPEDAYTLDSIVWNDHGNAKNVITSQTTDGATFKAHLNMGAATLDNNTEATLTAYVTVNKRPSGGAITNSAAINPDNTGITDADLTNNYAKVSTQIIATDLSIKATHQDIFYQGDPGDQIYLRVKNNGPDATGTTTTITDTLPAGLSFVGWAGNGWIVTENGGIVTAVYNGSIPSGGDFPVLTMKVQVAPDAASNLDNKGMVRVSTDNDSSNNDFKDNICIQQFSAGQIGQDQTIQDKGIPSAFTEITAASTTTGANITHQWQVSTDGVNWTNIKGATDAGYQPIDEISSTTYYRRLDNATDRNQPPVPSNVITVTVKQTTLAIDLKNFDGSYKDGMNQLIWVTATELDNKGFELYRSTDMGVTWSKIAFIAGKGTTTNTSTYHYEEKVLPGVKETQYKLSIIDNNGKSSWSPIASIKAPANTSIKLYPNPAHDYIFISGVSGIASIYDGTGRQVLRATINGASQPAKIGIQNLAKGVYFVLIDGHQFKFIKK